MVVILHKVTNYLLKYKVFIDISAMMPQFVEGLTLYLTRRAQRAQKNVEGRISLTVYAGAGGVAVARDGGRRLFIYQRDYTDSHG